MLAPIAWRRGIRCCACGAQADGLRCLVCCRQQRVVEARAACGLCRGMCSGRGRELPPRERMGGGGRAYPRKAGRLPEGQLRDVAQRGACECFPLVLVPCRHASTKPKMQESHLLTEVGAAACSACAPSVHCRHRGGGAQDTAPGIDSRHLEASIRAKKRRSFGRGRKEGEAKEETTASARQAEAAARTVCLRCAAFC